MPRYSVNALYVASSYVGEFDASSPEEAEAMAEKVFEQPGLCHQCSSEIEAEWNGEFDVSEIDSALNNGGGE